MMLYQVESGSTGLGQVYYGEVETIEGTYKFTAVKQNGILYTNKAKARAAGVDVDSLASQGYNVGVTKPSGGTIQAQITSASQPTSVTLGVRTEKTDEGYFQTQTITKLVSGTQNATAEKKQTTETKVKTGDVVTASVSDNGNDLTISVNGEETTFSPVHYYSVNSSEKQDNYENDGATGANAMAAGVAASAAGDNGTAVGAQSSAAGENATALGASATASAANALAAGANAKAEGESSIAIGNTANASAANALAAGASAKAEGESSIAIGNTANASAANALAAGISAKAEGESSIAIGNGSSAASADSIAIGTGNTVKGDKSIAIGTGHTVEGEGNAVIGDPNTVTGANNQVLANNSTVTGDNNVAIGNEVTVEASDGVAVGSSSQVSVDGGVALGSKSVASTDAGEAGYDPDTESASTDTSSTWKSTAAAVSVGDAGNDVTRQITGVAAGTQDTDAVNVAQLKKAGSNIEFNGDTGEAISKPKQLNIVGGITDESKLTTEDNIGVVSDGDKNLKVRLAKDIKGVDTVTVNKQVTVGGNTTINKDGMTIKGGPQITKNNVSMGGQQIHNVAAGTAATDAVNYSQLKQSEANFDQKLNHLNGRIGEVAQDANAGIAMALAAASLPQAYLPGKSMMAIAGGTYRGEQGYAIGFSTVTDDGKWIIKANASGNTQGHYGAAVGAGYMW
ncbi:MAG: YadA-like family protein [Oxalobacter sp.]|nr:YadA-like family protein [Oxalobacter sp.]